MFGTLAGMVTYTVLLLVFSLILVAAEQLPRSPLQPTTMLIVALGVFLAGYVAVRMSSGHGTLYGIGSALLPSELLFLTGLTVSGESISVFTFIEDLIMVSAGAIADILSVNKKSRQKQAFQVSILVL